MSGPRARSSRCGRPDPIDPGVRIGHVHLRTADIDRVRDFYVGVLGFDVVFEARDVPGWGTTGDILFLSAGGYHHHLGFNTWKSAGGAAAARRRRRAAPRRAALPDARRRSPTPCGACRRSTGRCVSSPTTARTRRSTSPIPTATTSSSCWDRPPSSGRATPSGHAAARPGAELDLDALLALAPPPA